VVPEIGVLSKTLLGKRLEGIEVEKAKQNKNGE